MASRGEEFASHSLRAILTELPTGTAIEDSEEYQHALTGLFWFLPDVLGEVYAEWKFIGLDGLYPVVARKTAEREIEFFGQCCFVSDQTLTPVHIRLQVAPRVDEISWMELRVGAMGRGGMVRMPYSAKSRGHKRLYTMIGRENEIQWVYKVSFGERST